MPDRKQVIFDIERCTCHVPDACKDCSHYQKEEAAIDCMEILLTDALALLREQETTFVKEEDRTNHYHCEKCGYVTGIIARMHKYCPECGRKVMCE